MEAQTGKTALVTGATSGIGRELATLFAREGYNLVLVARTNDSLQQAAREYQQQYGILVTPIARDLTDPKAPEEIYDETKRKGIQVDVLINNAGMGEYGMFASETDLQKELGIVQLNVSALVHLTKLYLKDMTQRNEGKILMLASVVSVLPNPMMAVYGATKSFILSFSEALRNELKDTNITVTALMPGATNTDFFNKAGAEGTRVHQQAQQNDPATVAKDGYEALMKGKDKVISGFLNKAQVAASYVMPDAQVSNSVRRQMERPTETDSRKDDTALLLTAVAVGMVAATAILWAFGSSSNNAPIPKTRARSLRSAKNTLLDALSLN